MDEKGERMMESTDTYI